MVEIEHDLGPRRAENSMKEKKKKNHENDTVENPLEKLQPRRSLKVL